jgi:hypothetical protein
VRIPPHALSGLSGASQALPKRVRNHVGMTLTLAIVINAILMAGICVAVAHVIHLPHRIERKLKLGNAMYVPGDDSELRRAA